MAMQGPIDRKGIQRALGEDDTSLSNPWHRSRHALNWLSINGFISRYGGQGETSIFVVNEDRWQAFVKDLGTYL